MQVAPIQTTMQRTTLTLNAKNKPAAGNLIVNIGDNAGPFRALPNHRASLGMPEGASSTRQIYRFQN